MRGSRSIKAVLPTVAPDLDCGALHEVHEGTEAQMAYEEATRPHTPAPRREAIRRNLLAYCARDTQAIVELVRYFQSV